MKDPIKTFFCVCVAVSFAALCGTIYAQDKIELDTTTIKGNSELPKILYVVPWSDTNTKKTKRQKLVLHSLFGEFFEPILPHAPPAKPGIEKP